MVLEETSLGGALHLAESMRQAVEALGLAHQGSRASDVVTVTLGAACVVPSLGQSPQTLLRMADRKLYEAKLAGRNRVFGETAC